MFYYRYSIVNLYLKIFIFVKDKSRILGASFNIIQYQIQNFRINLSFEMGHAIAIATWYAHNRSDTSDLKRRYWMTHQLKLKLHPSI
jgi:hypothetical protein